MINTTKNFYDNLFYQQTVEKIDRYDYHLKDILMLVIIYLNKNYPDSGPDHPENTEKRAHLFDEILENFPFDKLDFIHLIKFYQTDYIEVKYVQNPHPENLKRVKSYQVEDKAHNSLVINCEKQLVEKYKYAINFHTKTFLRYPFTTDVNYFNFLKSTYRPDVSDYSDKKLQKMDYFAFLSLGAKISSQILNISPDLKSRILAHIYQKMEVTASLNVQSFYTFEEPPSKKLSLHPKLIIPSLELRPLIKKLSEITDKNYKVNKKHTLEDNLKYIDQKFKTQQQKAAKSIIRNVETKYDKKIKNEKVYSSENKKDKNKKGKLYNDEQLYELCIETLMEELQEKYQVEGHFGLIQQLKDVKLENKMNFTRYHEKIRYHLEPRGIDGKCQSINGPSKTPNGKNNRIRIKGGFRAITSRCIMYYFFHEL